MKKAIDKAATTLGWESGQFFIAQWTKGDGNGIQLRFKSNYEGRLVFFAALVDTIMTDYAEKYGADVLTDLRNILERTIELSDRKPAEG